MSTTDHTITADLEQDGIVMGVAQACIATLRESANVATPEVVVRLAAKEIAAELGEPGAFAALSRIERAERVAGRLHSWLKSQVAGLAQLRGAEPAGSAGNSENVG